MSLITPKKIIELGDPVVIYSNKEELELIHITADKIFDGKHGHYSHNSLIGLEYGSKVEYKRTKDTGPGGFVYLLYPTPELWTSALRHRTEILYTTDISVISLQLELKPGMVVFESGTGSGSLSSCIARSIAPTGHLFTFEFHQVRADKAVIDFQSNLISHLITVECRDVLANGFGVANKADAIFLDLPSPWLAIGHAVKTLKANRKLCSFSPCIEQVQRTCVALAEHNFHDIMTIECLTRPYDVRILSEPGDKRSLKRARQGFSDSEVLGEIDVSQMGTVPTQAMKGHSGFLTFARKIITLDF